MRWQDADAGLVASIDDALEGLAGGLRDRAVEILKDRVGGWMSEVGDLEDGAQTSPDDAYQKGIDAGAEQVDSQIDELHADEFDGAVDGRTLLRELEARGLVVVREADYEEMRARRRRRSEAGR